MHKADKASILLLFTVLYGFLYMGMGIAAMLQKSRVIKWFREWNPQLAAKELPLSFAGDIGFLFSKRAGKIMQSHQLLSRQRRWFMALAIACLAMFAAYPVIWLILGLCLGL